MCCCARAAAPPLPSHATPCALAPRSGELGGSSDAPLRRRCRRQENAAAKIELDSKLQQARRRSEAGPGEDAPVAAAAAAEGGAEA